MKKFTFIFRLHPLLQSNFQFSKDDMLFLKNSPNFIISKNTLDLDIKSSNWILYRVSSTIFKGIKSGLLPVYLNLEEEISS